MVITLSMLNASNYNYASALAKKKKKADTYEKGT